MGNLIPVICSHPFKKSEYGNDCMIYKCDVCHQEWSSFDVPRDVIVGYVKSEGK